MAKKLFVGGLPWSFTDNDLASMFQPFGAVNSAVIILDRMNGNRSKGFGFVEMEIDNEAEAAIQNLNETEIADPANPERTRKIIVNEARPQEKRESSSRERRF
jgi:RNA recognition motif-containing protein